MLSGHGLRSRSVGSASAFHSAQRISTPSAFLIWVGISNVIV
jgi:hypothetical protein